MVFTAFRPLKQVETNSDGYPGLVPWEVEFGSNDNGTVGLHGLVLSMKMYEFLRH